MSFIPLNLVPITDVIVAISLAIVISMLLMVSVVLKMVPRPRSYREFVLILLGKMILTVIIAISLGEALIVLVEAQLIDYPLVVSLVLAEVPIAVFLHYITGEHHRSDSEKTNDAISKVRAISSFGHLHIYYVKLTLEYDYPALKCWIVNTRTNRAFYIREEIRQLVKDNVITSTTFETKEKLEAEIKRLGIIEVSQEYQAGDLD